MGRALQDCPQSDRSLLHVAHNDNPNVVPHTYWWIGRGALDAYSSWLVSGRKVTLHFGVHTRYGYPQKVFFQVTSARTSAITLRGWNLHTRQSILSGVGDDRPLPVFARGLPNMIDVPVAGCYVIQAQWMSGSWSLYFAAGCWPDRRMYGVDPV